MNWTSNIHKILQALAPHRQAAWRLMIRIFPQSGFDRAAAD
jgi:hypothetical protein